MTESSASEASLLANVNPELIPSLKALFSQSPARQPLSESLQTMRSMMANFGRDPAADIPHVRHEIPGMEGQPRVTVYVINAKQGESRPAILNMHGGGYVMGSAASQIADLQDYARELGCVVVTVDYRLAPETSYRGSVEDNYAALKWLHGQADELGVDRSRIAVMGESAGGGHAAILAIVARDRGEVPIAFQCLISPMLDDRTGVTQPVPDHIGQLLWRREDNRFGWESFLGMQPGTAGVPDVAVPARAHDLSGLPPAWIGVGSLDLFVNENIDYAQRLNNAGVQTELIVVPGAFHGFLVIDPTTRPARDFNAAMLRALRNGLHLS